MDYDWRSDAERARVEQQSRRLRDAQERVQQNLEELRCAQKELQSSLDEARRGGTVVKFRDGGERSSVPGP
jgi:chromosome segregation ATPase